MTYEQALGMLKTFFGKDPSLVPSMDLQRAYIPLGIPLELRSNLQTAWYGANRAGITMEQRLVDKGFLTAPLPADTAIAPPPTLSGSQFAQDQFEKAVTTVNPDMAGYFAPPPVPVVSVPSALAAQESGAIGAASIASQMQAPVIPVPSIPVPAPAPTPTPTPSPAPAPVVDERDRIRAGLGLPPLSTTTPSTTPTPTPAPAPSPVTPPVATSPSAGSINVPSPVQSGYTIVPGGGEVDISTPKGVVTVPRQVILRGITFTFNESTGNWEGVTAEGYNTFTNITNQLDYTPTPNWRPATTSSSTGTTAGTATTTPSATSPSAATTPAATTPAATTPAAASAVQPSSVGPAGDAIAQQEYLNRLAAATAFEKRANEAYNLALRLAATEKETGVRRAEAEAYNAAMRGVAGLGARGIAGMGGLKIAAQRAASSAPLEKRMDALNAYLGKTSAASLLLEEEKAKALQSRQDANTAMLRANKIASDLASGATGTATTAGATQPYVPTVVSPLAQSQAAMANLNTLPPVIEVPKGMFG